MADLSAAEAAEYLGVSRQTLYAYVSRGLLVSEPSAEGRERRYPQWALDELRARRAERREPAAAALRWGTPVLESALTLIDGGRLYYRGRDAVQLSRSATFEEVAALLWDTEANGLFPAATARRRAAGRMADRLVTCLVERRGQVLPATLKVAAETVAALFAAAGAHGRGTLAERLARGWRTRAADDLRAALILCADHELNASAFTARVVAATDAPLHNALLAALCALEGRRHGGASAAVTDLLDEIDRIGAARACERRLAQHGSLPGFWTARPVYPSGDPRAAELLRRLDLPPRDAAAKAIAFAERSGGTPTIELALAALARVHRLPQDAAFAVFALGRSAGWVAHALEATAGGTLIRPRARYVGPLPTGASGSGGPARREGADPGWRKRP
jgi:citrate synthase